MKISTMRQVVLTKNEVFLALQRYVVAEARLGDAAGIDSVDLLVSAEQALDLRDTDGVRIVLTES